MDLNKIKEYLKWKPKEEYHFTLPDKEYDNNQKPDVKEEDLSYSKTIFTNLAQNLEYLHSRFNTMVNSDIIIREFTLIADTKQYKAFILFIDGMVNSDLINNFILKPLMLKTDNNRILSEEIKNNITIRKVKKHDITSYVSNRLLPQNTVKKHSEFEEIISGVNSGNCALFIDTLNISFDIEVKGYKQRSVDKPENEIIIKGPHEAFVENLRTNTSLLRRIINNEDLIMETIEVGHITKTKCSVCYMKDIANNDLVNEVKYRIHNLEVDSLLSTGQLEQLISDDNSLGIPELLSTERPDKVASLLLQGRVAVLINGNPYALIMPATIIDFMSSPEDKNLKPYFANFLKGIRLLAGFLSLLLPGIYVAITSFHQEILPTELLFSILASRQNVPFPVIFEILVLEISFEIIREAGLRVPSPIGPTIGIVGALVLGQAAVSANIVSPILIIIVAITGISSFAIPDFSFGFHLRFFRFIFIMLGFISGFLGVSLGLFAYISILCNLRSFRITYTTPIAPIAQDTTKHYFLFPTWRNEFRPSYLNPKKQKSQAKISMKWKYIK